MTRPARQSTTTVARPPKRPTTASGPTPPRPAGTTVDLGVYDPDFGYPAPKWFQNLEIIVMTNWGPLAGTMEFCHSAGAFEAARDGYYAASSFANAGLEDLKKWNAVGARSSVYQDNISYGIIEHNLGIEWVKENFRNKNVTAEWVLTNRWLPGQAGWPGKYVNKDGHEDEWCLYDAEGNWVWKWRFYPGRHLSCVNTQAVWDTQLTAVRSLMDMGHDAVMFDNFSLAPADCYGEELGKHTHRSPELSNSQAVAALYREMFRTIKSYHPDRVMWLNSQGKAPWIWFDAQIIESVFGHSKFEDRPTKDIFEYAIQMARQYQPAIEHGKVLVYMPYVLAPTGPGKGVPGDEVDHLFFSYAAARMGKFVMAKAALKPGGKADGKKYFYLGPLQWLRLKDVRSGIVELAKDIHIRTYERGVVVLNGTDQTQTLDLPLGSASLRAAGNLIDVRAEKAYPVGLNASSVKVEIPAWSGRVFATEEAFRLAKAHELPDRPKTWTAPLLPERKVAPPEVILEGPDAFRKWHAQHPDEQKYVAAWEMDAWPRPNKDNPTTMDVHDYAAE